MLYKKQQDKGGIITDTDDDVIDNDTWVGACMGYVYVHILRIFLISICTV